MKIVIEEARCGVNAEKSGIGKFYLGIKKLLSDNGFEPIVFQKDFLFKDSPILRRIKYFIWLNTVFLFKLLMLRDEVKVLGVNYYIPFIKIPRVKYYPVIHDLTAIKHPELIPKWNAFIIKLITKNAIKNGDKILTVSETAKKEIAEYFNYPKDNIYVVYNNFSLNKDFSNIQEENILNLYNLKDKKYILSVSSFSPHKNMEALVEAFNMLSKKYKDIYLVLVGKGPTINKCRQIAKTNIIFTEYIEEPELKVLYKNAIMYVFPSYIEGFGIPIIDAQNYQLPVVCSDIDVFKEVASEDGALFTKTTSVDIFQNIETLLSNNSLKEKLINNGIKNIERFSEQLRYKQLKKGIELDCDKY